LHRCVRPLSEGRTMASVPMRALFLLGLVGLPSGAAALSAGADFLRAEVPARASSMAGAFGANHDDASAFLWNPAALAWVKEPAVAATHFSSIIDTNFDQASFVQ